jgi:hypothetical protein
MSKKHLSVEIGFFPGSVVLVRNYNIRCREQWEAAEIIGTSISVDENKKYCIQHRVILERKSNAGNPLFLYVGEAALKEISN